MENEILTNLFRRELLKSSKIILEDHDHNSVGVLYLDKLGNPESIIITELSKSKEKYYIYLDSVLGHVGIFFTYYKKETS
jgi:hypothetical protein